MEICCANCLLFWSTILAEENKISWIHSVERMRKGWIKKDKHGQKNNDISEILFFQLVLPVPGKHRARDKILSLFSKHNTAESWGNWESDWPGSKHSSVTNDILSLRLTGSISFSTFSSYDCENSNVIR